MRMKKVEFAVNVEGLGGLRKKQFTLDNAGELPYAPCSGEIDFITEGGTLWTKS